jgi:regulator of nucleoside diphosphate kinase
MKHLDQAPITVSALDYDRLIWIATAGVNSQLDTIAGMLADELERAKIVTPDAIRPDVVTMHSEVEYQDEGTGEIRRITLVYPGQEDSDADRISILTSVGAALIGLSEGQSMEWKEPPGGWRRVTVRRVQFQPERMAGLGT